MSHSPFQRQELARLEALLNPAPDNPAALSIFGPTPTRSALRALPLQVILFGRPPLSFADDGGNAALIHELNDCRAATLKFRDPERRKLIAFKARRAWARLVEEAEGVAVPGTRYKSAVLFAD